MLRQLFYVVGCLSVGILLGSLLNRSLVAAPVLTLPQDIIGCPGDMVRAGPVCLDKYEASVWDSGAGTGTQYGASPAARQRIGDQGASLMTGPQGEKAEVGRSVIDPVGNGYAGGQMPVIMIVDLLRPRTITRPRPMKQAQGSIASWVGLAQHASAFRLSRALFLEHDVRNIGKRLLVKSVGG